MRPEERDELIERYHRGFQAVSEALDRVGPQRIDSAVDGEWSPRQVVHHLADAALFHAIRLRLLLAEDEPRLQAYDERRFASSLAYERPIASSLALLASVMDSNLELLAELDEDDWSRTGMHEELGSFSVEDWLQNASRHAHEDADQILKAVAI